MALGTGITLQTGKVYLVGSGPGHPAYLTLRGHQRLSQAEVLLYDALVDTQLLHLVSVDCCLIDVGKRGGQPSPSQGEINQLLVQHCRDGKQVVRLKTGDPFIFGRCASEIQALKTAGCAFEVVPGLSSALAAPLLASIPLTDSVLSRSFTVVSAHDPEALDWQTLSQVETLVILMGGRQLAEICQQLQRHGRSSQTPIAIIRWAAHPQQQVWVGNLADIVRQTVGTVLSPTVMVIGEVVRLRDYLQSADREQASGPSTADNGQTQVLVTDTAAMMNSQAPLPPPALSLAGKTVLVTRAAGQSAEFRDRLFQLGAEVIEMPTLIIGPPSTWEPLDVAIRSLSDPVAGFDWLILTSANGVEAFFNRLAAQDQDVRVLAGIKIAVVGKKTATRLQQRGINPDFTPPDFVADALVEHFPAGDDLSTMRLLFPRVESGGRDVLVKAFTERGATIVEVPAYESYCPEAIAPSALTGLQQHQVDIVTFASAKTVKNFCRLLEQAIGPDWQQTLKNVCIASIGPQTSAACHALLGHVDVEAQEYTLAGLTEAILAWGQSEKREKID